MDGTRYVFADALRRKTDHGIYSQRGANPPGAVWYTYTVKLSAILSNNYVDGGGDPLMPDPASGLDKGGRIKFEYSSILFSKVTYQLNETQRAGSLLNAYHF